MKQNPPKILGVIGDPIAHSLSPVMHNAALAHLHLPYLYIAFRVPPKNLKTFIATSKKQGIVGLNVTIPHKQAVMPLMDQLTSEAKKMGAVNTVIFKNNKLIGDNTDGCGFLLSLEKEVHFNAKGKRVILIGAGGAARAIALSLCEASIASLHIINRTSQNTLNLILQLKKHYPKMNISAGNLKKFNKLIWKKADLVINSTSMGMKGIKLPILPFAFLPKNAVACDIVYNPLFTPFLKTAKRHGLKTFPGWGMLLYQGALSFEKWTKRKAPIKVMKKALLDTLGQGAEVRGRK